MDAAAGCPGEGWPLGSVDSSWVGAAERCCGDGWPLVSSLVGDGGGRMGFGRTSAGRLYGAAGTVVSGIATSSSWLTQQLAASWRSLAACTTDRDCLACPFEPKSV